MLDRHLDVVLPQRSRAPTTVIGYRSLCVNQIYPRWGGQRIDRLLPEQLEDGYANMVASGLAGSSVRKVHAILSSAYEIEVRRGNVARNPCKLVEPPRLGQAGKAALSQLHARAVLNAAALRRNAARWSVGLACGFRQGEALGLRWPYVDLEAGELRVWFQLQRLPWRHGCANVAACTEGKHRRPCPRRCPKAARKSGRPHVCVPADASGCARPAAPRMPPPAPSGMEAAWYSGRSRNAAARRFPCRANSSPSSPLTGRSRNWNATWRRTSGKTTSLSSPGERAPCRPPRELTGMVRHPGRGRHPTRRHAHDAALCRHHRPGPGRRPGRGSGNARPLRYQGHPRLHARLIAAGAGCRRQARAGPVRGNCYEEP